MVRLVCGLVLILLGSGCPDSAATCRGLHVPDAAIPVCGEGPTCTPCWSCQDFGASPGWVVLPGTCGDAPVAPDAH